jgi:hypothetical protein
MPGITRDVDDGPLRRLQVRDGGRAQEERALQVHVHDSVEVRLAALLDWSLAPHARGIDERVEPPRRRDGTFDQSAAGVGGAHVAGQARDHRVGFEPFKGNGIEVDSDDAPSQRPRTA